MLVASDPLTEAIRSLLFAGAVLGTAEVFLHRVAAPVLSHIPSTTVDPTVAEVVDLAGQRAFHGAALLLVLAAAGVVVVTARGSTVVAVLAGASLLAAGLAAVADGPAARLVVQLVFVAAAAGVAGLATVHGPGWQRAALAVAAVSLIAGRLPFVHDALRDVAGGTSGFATAQSASVAEGAFVFVPVVLAAGLAARGGVTRLGWAAAGAGAAVSLVAIAGSPYTAIVSNWATGVTLSLPAGVYVISAGAAAMVLATWLRCPGTRLQAAGMVLFAVGGTQPAVIHHNLTAILGLLLLAGAVPALAATERVTNRATASD
ncbi:MAG: hypothetical protein Kow0010_08320 [Dehalococcoidia bacterium]